MTDPVTILIIGSPFGADTVGNEIYQWLMRENMAEKHPQWIRQIEYLDRPGSGLLEHLRKGNKVILIDAVLGGEEPGTVRVINRKELQRSELFSSHSFGVADTLALAEALGDLPDELIILGVEIGENVKPEMNEVYQDVEKLLQHEMGMADIEV